MNECLNSNKSEFVALYGRRCVGKTYLIKNGISWPGGQIDLIIDRDDNTINVCEIKYSNEEYIITKEYERTVMERNQNFKNDIKTKKSIICTFITTYGFKKNLYSSIVNKEVVIDDLFY